MCAAEPLTHESTHGKNIAARRLPGIRRKATAQAMAEFALVLPIMLLVMYGLIETGRVIFIYASVVSAARQAVRYGSTTGQNSLGTFYYNDCAGIKAAANKLAFLSHLNINDNSITYDNGPDVEPAELWTDPDCGITDPAHPANGDRIHVTVSANYSPIVPLVPFRNFTITSTSTRTLLVGVAVKVDVTPIVATPGGTGIIYLLKSCTPDTGVNVGQTIHYTYNIINQGSGPVSSLSVTDDKVSVDCSGAANPLAGGGRDFLHGQPCYDAGRRGRGHPDEFC